MRGSLPLTVFMYEVGENITVAHGFGSAGIGTVNAADVLNP